MCQIIDLTSFTTTSSSFFFFPLHFKFQISIQKIASSAFELSFNYWWQQGKEKEQSWMHRSQSQFAISDCWVKRERNSIFSLGNWTHLVWRSWEDRKCGVLPEEESLFAVTFAGHTCSCSYSRTCTAGLWGWSRSSGRVQCLLGWVWYGLAD